MDWVGGTGNIAAIVGGLFSPFFRFAISMYVFDLQYYCEELFFWFLVSNNIGIHETTHLPNK